MVLAAWANRTCGTYNASPASPAPSDRRSEGAGEGEANTLIKAVRPPPPEWAPGSVSSSSNRREDGQDVDSVSVTFHEARLQTAGVMAPLWQRTRVDLDRRLGHAVLPGIFTNTSVAHTKS